MSACGVQNGIISREYSHEETEGKKQACYSFLQSMLGTPNLLSFSFLSRKWTAIETLKLLSLISEFQFAWDLIASRMGEKDGEKREREKERLMLM